METRPHLHLRIRSADGEDHDVTFVPHLVLNAAYAGRNPEDVARHIADVQAKGIPANVSIPSLSPVAAHNLVMHYEVQEYSRSMMGEVEYVLIWHAGEVFVGVGSDHCDFWLEQHSFDHSKNAAPNVIAGDIWRLADVQDHFDDLILECSVFLDGKWVVAQRAACSTLRSPEFWIASAAFRRRDMDGTVLFSGTINHLDGFKQGARYRVALEDPVANRSIRHEYACIGIAAPGLI